MAPEVGTGGGASSPPSSLASSSQIPTSQFRILIYLISILIFIPQYSDLSIIYFILYYPFHIHHVLYFIQRPVPGIHRDYWCPSQLPQESLRITNACLGLPQGSGRITSACLMGGASFCSAARTPSRGYHHPPSSLASQTARSTKAAPSARVAQISQ